MMLREAFAVAQGIGIAFSNEMPDGVLEAVADNEMEAGLLKWKYQQSRRTGLDGF